MARAAIRVLARIAPLAMLAACSQERKAGAPPVFDADIAPILTRACVSCHGETSPAAGWRATSFLDALGCVAPSGHPATLPATSRAPILAALGIAPHVGVLTADERSKLEAWVAAGTPAFTGTVHTPGIIDPRSAAFHGAILRAKRWSPMLDPNDPASCGRCHDGAPSRPPGVTISAPGAPACTTCHAEPEGTLACSTCHGQGGRIYPPRDLCAFPNDATTAGAHAAHVEGSSARPAGFTCTTCHPAPPAGVIAGLHGNGIVDVAFDPSVAGEGTFDPQSGACAVRCHDSGGARPRPSWNETALMGCGDCHGSPPAKHFPGACSRCHAEANATGTALTAGPLHLDGKIDLGDGSGRCGACHGKGDDPWPATAAHPSHKSSSLTSPIACASCHVVPQTILDPAHLGGVAKVTFSGLAVARGTSPSWDGTSCNGVACHGAGLADTSEAPAWNDATHAASTCGACHGIPPKTQHTTSTTCAWSNCHGSEIGAAASGTPFITDGGKVLHVNGVVDVAR